MQWEKNLEANLKRFRANLKARVKFSRKISRNFKICNRCSKKWHYIKECKYEIDEEKKKAKANISQATMIVDEDKGLVAMITEVNLAPSAKKNWMAPWFKCYHLCLE